MAGPSRTRRCGPRVKGMVGPNPVVSPSSIIAFGPADICVEAHPGKGYTHRTQDEFLEGRCETPSKIHFAICSGRYLSFGSEMALNLKDRQSIPSHRAIFSFPHHGRGLLAVSFNKAWHIAQRIDVVMRVMAP